MRSTFTIFARYMDKVELIDKIWEDGLGNNILSIYYKIGGALPFVARRFPGGRVSSWYASQCALVTRVEPGGKSGKYGKAYGFYYRDGKREDSCWCKKDDTEPQEIPCAACGSWVLLDILGEPVTEPVKHFGLNDVIDLGVYKGLTLSEVIHKDWGWVKWASLHHHFTFNWDEVMSEREKDIIPLHPDDVFPEGKYKGQTLREVAEVDFDYLKWFDENKEDYIIDFDEFNDVSKGIKVLHPEDKMPIGKYKGKKIKKIAEIDYGYLKWMDSKRNGFIINFDELDDSVKEVKILHPNDKLTYGKYKGKRIIEIAKKRMVYLQWLESQNDDIKIGFEELNAELEKTDSNQFQGNKSLQVLKEQV